MAAPGDGRNVARDGRDTVGFTRQDGRRVADATRIVEKSVKGGGPYGGPGNPGRGHNRGVWDFPLRFAKTPGGGIPAMAGVAPGTADCDLYDFDGTNLVISGDTGIAVYNAMTAGAISANAFVIVGLIGGAWFVLADPCG